MSGREGVGLRHKARGVQYVPPRQFPGWANPRRTIDAKDDAKAGTRTPQMLPCPAPGLVPWAVCVCACVGACSSCDLLTRAWYVPDRSSSSSTHSLRDGWSVKARPCSTVNEASPGGRKSRRRALNLASRAGSS